MDKRGYRSRKRMRRQRRTLLFVLAVVFIFFGMELVVQWGAGMGSWLEEMKNL